jgi:hypothetical protein
MKQLLGSQYGSQYPDQDTDALTELFYSEIQPTRTMLKQALLLCVVVVTACQSAKTKPSAPCEMPAYKGSAAFERMKSLVGEWSATSPEMGKMETEFRLIAGGSVIEEHFGEDTPMEMLSVYHDVNGKLTMTHF